MSSRLGELTAILSGRDVEVLSSGFVPPGQVYIFDQGRLDPLGTLNGGLTLFYDHDYRDADSPIYEEVVAELGTRPLPRSPRDDLDQLRRQYEALLKRPGLPPIETSLLAVGMI